MRSRHCLQVWSPGFSRLCTRNPSDVGTLMSVCSSPLQPAEAGTPYPSSFDFRILDISIARPPIPLLPSPRGKISSRRHLLAPSLNLDGRHILCFQRSHVI